MTAHRCLPAHTVSALWSTHPVAAQIGVAQAAHPRQFRHLEAQQPAQPPVVGQQPL